MKQVTVTPGNYFEVEQFVTQWKEFGEPYLAIASYRRPLQSMLDLLVKAGFVVDKILEPKPIAEFQLADPKHYDKLMREPGFFVYSCL